MQFLRCQGSQCWASANVVLIKIVGCGTPESSLHVSAVLLHTAVHCNIPCTCLHQRKTHMLIWTLVFPFLFFFCLWCCWWWMKKGCKLGGITKTWTGHRHYEERLTQCVHNFWQNKHCLLFLCLPLKHKYTHTVHLAVLQWDLCAVFHEEKFWPNAHTPTAETISTHRGEMVQLCPKVTRHSERPGEVSDTVNCLMLIN